MIKVLMIGGNGFLGKNLQRLFLDKGLMVFVVDNMLDRISDEEKCVFLSGDDPDIFKKIADEKIDIALILAHIKMDDDEEGEVSGNIHLCNYYVKGLLGIGIKKIVYFSSGGRVYGDYDYAVSEDMERRPQCSYGLAKLVTEEFFRFVCIKNGIDYLILRPSNPYGRWQYTGGKQGLIYTAITKAINNETIEVWGDGNDIRDYIYIDDFCEAVFLLLNNGSVWNNVFNVGSGKGHTTNYIIKHIEKVSGKKLTLEYRMDKLQLIKKNILAIKKIASVTNFMPATEVERGIEMLYEIIELGVEA